MKEQASRFGFIRSVGLAALIWGSGSAVYGLVEALTNTAVGLYQPVRIWAFAVAVYGVLGLLGGAGAGAFLQLSQRILPWTRLSEVRVLMAAFLAGFLLVYLGIPINDRLMPDFFSPASLVGNTLLVAFSAAASLLFCLHLRAVPQGRLPLSFLLLSFCLSLCLAVGLYIDGYVAGGSATPGRLLVYGALVAACVLFYLVADRVVRLVPGRLLSVAGTFAVVLLGLGVLVAEFARKTTSAERDALRQPNLLWIVMDTARADHMSTYGYPHDTTPNLDVLAEDSTVFENAVAPSSWTIPTHFQMVTSRFEAGTRKVLDPSFITAAEILRAKGYDTGAVIANFSLGRRSGFDQGFDTYIDGPVMIFYLKAFEKLPVVKMILRLGIFPPDAVLRMLDRKIFLDAEAVRGEGISNHAMRWIDEHASRPFFLFLNYMDPHDSYDPPQPYRDAFAPSASPTSGFIRWDSDRLESISSNEFVRDVMPHLDESEWGDLVNLYDAEIAYLDDQIGRLITLLKKRGLYDRTVIVVTSDHGELFGEHGLGTHFKALTEEEIHVPLLMRYAGILPAGRKVATPVQLADVLPTALDTMGISTEVDMDGRSLLPLLRGEEKASDPRHGEAFSFLIRKPNREFPHTAPGHLFSLRKGNLKYVWSSTGRHEFYDLTTDPTAHRNLYGERPEVAAAERRLSEWREAFALTGLETYEAEEIDRITRERLEALGYVD